MTLAAGTRLGPYEIVSPLGAGGMGEVYRATDTKLGREVAIKVLPDSFAQDPERLARFEREAKVLASLNHPHIASIYGLEEAGEVRALVLELVEGPTLAERLAQSTLPLEECLSIARQIAEALEEAHDKGIVHRDLKPANVKLTPGGKVKVLDFGLAKALDPMTASGASASQLAHSPTLTLGATVQGVILGTAAYMSPEQARGSIADRRADVWAFGVVLFEMLSGRPLFAGPTVSDTLASVLKVEPDLAQLPPDTPSKIRRLLERCLRKNPHERLHSVADARIVLEEVLRGELDEPAAAIAAAVAPPRPRWQIAAALGAAAVAGGALAVALVELSRADAAPLEVVRFQIPQPAKLPIVGAPKLSPDGRYLAFDATDDQGTARVWVRALNSLEAQPLGGTEGVTARPFWSPDSRFLGFMAGGKLKRIEVTGGPPQTICDAPTGADGTWSEAGVILYDGSGADPIMKVAAGGGVPVAFVQGGANARGLQVGWPQFLPGGERFLYVNLGEGDEGGVRVANADGSDDRLVVSGLSRVEYALPGHLLFVREETLVAQRFDADSGELRGEPVPVAEGLGTDNVGLAEFSVSRSGHLAYRAGLAGQARYVWLDRKGNVIEAATEPGELANAALSPDGRWLAYQLETASGRDVWVRDLKRGVPSRFTFDEGSESAPLFDPSGRRVLYARAVDGEPNRIVVRALDRTGEEELLFESADLLSLADVTPDGESLVFVRRKADEPWATWLLPIGHPDRARPLVANRFWNYRAQVAPNGRWLAFQSDESGQNEIYVIALAASSGRWQISTRGGSEPHWGPDGRELFYLSPESRMMRVEVDTGAAFEAGIPEPMFIVSLDQSRIRNRLLVSNDGQRFLALAPQGDQQVPPTTVVLNWSRLLTP